MKKRSDTLEYYLDCLSRVGNIGCRAMFGGYGLYVDKVIFAIVVDDVLYFKVADNNRDDYTARGARPFQYHSNGKSMTMSYYEVPESILEDPDELRQWVQSALKAHTAKRSKQNKPRRAS